MANYVWATNGACAGIEGLKGAFGSRLCNDKVLSMSPIKMVM